MASVSHRRHLSQKARAIFGFFVPSLLLFWGLQQWRCWEVNNRKRSSPPINHTIQRGTITAL